MHASSLRSIVVLLLVVATGLSLAATAVANPPVADGGVAGEQRVLVQTAAGVQEVDLPGQATGVDGWRVVEPRGNETAAQAVARARRDPRVSHAYIEPTYPISALGDGTPNDPLIRYQWHLDQIGLRDAWPRATGSGVTVAIIDTGVTRGEDLRCRDLVGEYDAVDDVAGPGHASDDNGHGTHVAGTVAQCTDNGRGGAGVAPRAGLLAIRAIGSDGRGRESDIVRGIDWAVKRGADVINLSLGRPCSAPWPTCGTTMMDEALERAVDAGLVVVGAAGNDEADYVSYPAAHPDVIAVTATASDRSLARYSNHGEGASVSAPGGDGVDRDKDGYPDAVLQGDRRDGYALYSGTSMATPHVAGIAALLLGADSTISPSAVRDVIESTARDLGPTGWDARFGHGEVRADRAVEFVLGSYGAGFEDVSSLSIFHDAIVWLSEQGITRGCNADGTRFCPGVAVTRAQMAAFLMQALDLPEGDGLAFEDVDEGSLFADPVDRLATAGITKGCNPPDNDQFCPSRSVTRAEMAAFLARALALPEADEGFLDVMTDSIFAESIGALADAGITKGCNPPDNDRFCPSDPVSRAQMAAFLERALA